MKTMSVPVTTFFDKDDSYRNPGNLGVLENTLVVDFTTSYGRTKCGVIDGVEAIQGDLVIKKKDSSTVSDQEAIFPDLVCVGGNLIIEETTISVCDFPLLHSVGKNIIIHNNINLTIPVFTNVRYVKGAVIITNNDRLELFDFPAGCIEHDLTVCNNSSLTKLDLRHLSWVGRGEDGWNGFHVEDNSNLKDIYAPCLQHINGGVRVHNNAKVARMVMGAKIPGAYVVTETLSAGRHLDEYFGPRGFFERINLSCGGRTK